MLQAIGGVIFLKLANFQLIKQGDSAEYIALADNILQGNGYSTEKEAPYLPNGSRPPGTLVLNLPFRFLFSQHDALAIVTAKIVLLAAALLVVAVAAFFVDGSFAILTGALLTIIPSVMYYSVTPYSSSLPYLLSITAIFASCSVVLRSGKFGYLLLLISSAYSMAIRPAALFPLVMMVLVAFLLGFFFKNDKNLRLQLWGISAIILVGTSVANLGWSLRNLNVLGKFEYSSVNGINILWCNAQGMLPYLDPAGQKEVLATVNSLLIITPEYSGLNQLEISTKMKQEGIRLLWSYKRAFLTSHFVGVLKSLLLFDVFVLNEKLGSASTYLVAAYQFLFTFMGAIGIWLSLQVGNNSQRAFMLLMIAAGGISVLSAGMIGQPRFRLPLEIPVAIGCIFFLQTIFQKSNKSNLRA